MGFASVLLLALLVGGCSLPFQPSGAQEAPQDQQVLHTYAYADDLAGLDPANAGNDTDYELASLVFPALVTLGDHLSPTPWAATDLPDVDPSGTVYTFHLRPGLAFSDGEPIDSSAFAFAIDRSINPCTGASLASDLFQIRGAQAFHAEECPDPHSGLASGPIHTLIGDGLTVPDSLTLRITLQQPAAGFLAQITSPAAFALPQGLVQRYGASWTDHLADGDGLGGSLFKVTAWDPTKAVQGSAAGTAPALVLSRNNAFWGIPPILQSIQVTVYSETLRDQYHEYQDYLDGRYDVFHTAIPETALSSARQRADYHETPAQLAIYGFALDWQHPPFDDLRARQAFALALDKQALADAASYSGVLGRAMPTNHLVPPGILGSNPDLRGPDGTSAVRGNPEQAQELIVAYARDKCGGVIAHCPPVMLLLPDETPVAFGAAVTQMWNATLPGYPVAFEVDHPHPLNAPQPTPQVMVDTRAWPAASTNAEGWLSDQFLPGASAVPFPGVSVPDATTLLRQADAQSDPGTSAPLYAQAEQILVTQVAAIPLYQWQTPYLVRARVVGYQPDQRGINTLATWQHIRLLALDE